MKLFSLLFFSSVISVTAFSQWTQTNGPVGVQSSEIFYVGNYLVVNGYDGGVFRSSDKGETWEPINEGLPTDFRCFTMATEKSKLYIATNDGIYYSGDFGDLWQPIGLADLIAFSLEVSGDEIFAGKSSGGFYYSPDRGNTWVLKDSPISPITNAQDGIEQILKFGGTLWIGSGSHLYSSSDNGSTWDKSELNLVVSGLNNADGDLFVSGNDVYGIFSVYKSSDDGLSWTPLIQTQETNVGVSGFMKAGNEIFISGVTTFYYSADNGLTWVSNLLPMGLAYSKKSFISSIDSNLFISYSDGILLSSDKGATWQKRNAGYRNHTINKLVKTTNAIMTLNETNGVFVSTDMGDHWKGVNDPKLIFARYIYGYDNTLIVSYDLEVYKSVDDGVTWQKIFTLIDDIVGTHFVPVIQLAGSKESLVLCTYKGLYFSENLGATWSFEPKSSFDTDEYLLESFVQQDTVIVLTSKEMFYSTDFGVKWQKKALPNDVNSFPYILTLDMLLSKSSILMSTNSGLFRSTDFGSSWTKVSCIPSSIIFDIEKVGETLILCTDNGVFASANNGIDWYSVHAGLNNDANVFSIIVTEQFAFIGTWGKSVWRMPTSELLTVGELVQIDHQEVIKPMVKIDCSSVTVVNSTNEVDIKWYKNGDLIPNETDKTLVAKGSGVYTVSFENSCDVKMSDEVKIGETSRTDIKTYNIITANEDGKNDYYFVDENLIGSSLMIYGRWGDLVYSSKSYRNDWSPDQISGGQYFYVIENQCYGKFKGTLTVLKP